MPRPVCLDANLIIALVVTEQATPRVNALWQAWISNGRRRVAPRVLPFEVARGLQRKIHASELSRRSTRAALAAAEKLIAHIELRRLTGGLVDVLDLAESLQLHLFDGCYAVLARQEGAELWTLDGLLAERAGGKMP